MEDKTKTLKICLTKAPEGKFNKEGKQAIFDKWVLFVPIWLLCFHFFPGLMLLRYHHFGCPLTAEGRKVDSSSG